MEILIGPNITPLSIPSQVPQLPVGQKSRNNSITNATFCLAQPKQVNMGLETIFGSSNIYLDQVLANKLFLIIKINC